LSGIDYSASVTLDPHKWLSLPRSCGLLLIRDRSEAREAFAIEAAYGEEGIDDLADYGIQWSRRALGFPLWLVLQREGQKLESLVDRTMDLGAFLRDSAEARGWVTVNDSPLPLACLARDAHQPMDMDAYECLVKNVRRRGFWCTTSKSPRPSVRVCVTSYMTTEADIEDFVTALDEAARES
jgi:aromatic-L-amino-acid/L-tryptophan decarboxylase